MTDSDILKIAYNKIGRVNAKLIYYIDKPENLELKNYLLNRYADIPENLFSYKEVLWRISHNIEIRPVCEYCGNPNIEFKGFQRKNEPNAFPNGFKRTCSDECSRRLWKEKSTQTIIDKYGVENVFQSTDIQDKIKQTCIHRYGVENPAQSSDIQKKVENTLFSHYGVKRYLSSPEGREKYKNTCISRFGVSNPSQLETIKKKKRNTLLRNYGVTNPSYDASIREKRLDTKRKNGTFTSSAPEDTIYLLFKSVYQNTVRQYTSEKYPYMCDFYIPEIDTYIEYNGNWTHGGHPFDSDNNEDNARLKEWKNKNTPYYNSAVDVWSKRDPEKRRKATESGIRYIELWSIDDAVKFIKEKTNGKG